MKPHKNPPQYIFPRLSFSRLIFFSPANYAFGILNNEANNLFCKLQLLKSIKSHIKSFIRFYVFFLSIYILQWVFTHQYTDYTGSHTVKKNYIMYKNQMNTHAFNCQFQMYKCTFLKPASGGGHNLEGHLKNCFCALLQLVQKNTNVNKTIDCLFQWKI